MANRSITFWCRGLNVMSPGSERFWCRGLNVMSPGSERHSVHLPYAPHYASIASGVVPRHAASYHVKSRHVTPVTSCHSLSRGGLSCRVASRRVASRRIVPCRAMSCHAISSIVIVATASRHITRCHVGRPGSISCCTSGFAPTIHVMPGNMNVKHMRIRTNQ